MSKPPEANSVHFAQQPHLLAQPPGYEQLDICCFQLLAPLETIAALAEEDKGDFSSNLARTNLKITDPQTRQQAMSSPQAKEWLAAEAVELGNLQRNQTWEALKNMPTDTCGPVMPSKWVYTVKYKKDLITLQWTSSKPGLSQEAIAAFLALTICLKKSTATS
jgi:hypothetical protein